MAFGGIDFGGSPPLAPPPAPANEPGIITAALQSGLPAQHATETLRSAGPVFGPLPGTGEEVGYLKGLYFSLRPREAAPRVLRDAGASKAALNTLLNQHTPPRVLHLATHGFFLSDQSTIARPLLKAGVALAGANAGAEGLLYAIEAQGLVLRYENLTFRLAQEIRNRIQSKKGGVHLPNYFPAQKSSVCSSRSLTLK